MDSARRRVALEYLAVPQSRRSLVPLPAHAGQRTRALCDVNPPTWVIEVTGRGGMHVCEACLLLHELQKL